MESAMKATKKWIHLTNFFVDLTANYVNKQWINKLNKIMTL